MLQIHPDLRELMETMNRMSILPADFEGRQKIGKWWVQMLNDDIKVQ